MPSGRDFNSEQKNKILRLALAGLSVDQIKERTGWSRSAIAKYYPRSCLPGRHRNDENGGSLK